MNYYKLVESKADGKSEVKDLFMTWSEAMTALKIAGQDHFVQGPTRAWWWREDGTVRQGALGGREINTMQPIGNGVTRCFVNGVGYADFAAGDSDTQPCGWDITLEGTTIEDKDILWAVFDAFRKSEGFTDELPEGTYPSTIF